MRESSHAVGSSPYPGIDVARRTLLGLGIAATLTGDVVLATTTGRFPDWSAVLLVGIALGQVIVAAAWLALGQSSWLARCVTFPLAAIALAHLLASKVEPSAGEMLGVLLAVGAAVAIPLFAARLAGLRLTASSRRNRESLRRGRRYSLASLFALTTVVAVFAAIAREASFPNGQMLTAAMHCIGFAAVALIPAAMLCSEWQHARRFWLPAAVLLGAAWSAASGPISHVAAVELAFLWVAASVVFDCGCRISWSPTLAVSLRCNRASPQDG